MGPEQGDRAKEEAEMPFQREESTRTKLENNIVKN